MRLQACVGSVCVGVTALMCRGRECARLGSATRLVSFYVSLVGSSIVMSNLGVGQGGPYLSAFLEGPRSIYM